MTKEVLNLQVKLMAKAPRPIPRSLPHDKRIAIQEGQAKQDAEMGNAVGEALQQLKQAVMKLDLGFDVEFVSTDPWRGRQKGVK